MAQADHVHDFQNGNQILGRLDRLQSLDQVLGQRVNTLDVGFRELKEQATQAAVALEDRIDDVVDVVDEQVRRAARDQVKVAADLAQQLTLYVAVLQEFDADGHCLLGQLWIQIVLS